VRESPLDGSHHRRGRVDARGARARGDDPASLTLDSELPIDRLAHRAVVTGHRQRLATGPRMLAPIFTPMRRLVLRSISSFLVDILHQINDFHADAARVLEDHEQRLSHLEHERHGSQASSRAAPGESAP
jgi:hypothetical protein